MNIFLPYEDSIEESVKALDDVRLNKQAVEIYQLLDLAMKEKLAGQEVRAGHYHHPVYLFYKYNIPFLAYYGYECCREYCYRFKNVHSLVRFFDNELKKQSLCCIDNEGYIKYLEIPKFTPYYMEGSIGQPNYIRTTDGVSGLFRAKLINKWQADKAKGRNPKWTNREMPEFYKKYLKYLEVEDE